MREIFPVVNGSKVKVLENIPIRSTYSGEAVSKLYFADRMAIKNLLSAGYSPQEGIKERLDILSRFGKKLKARSLELAEGTTKENGSPIRFTEAQAIESASFAQELDRLTPDLEEKYVLEPKGTVLLGVPFNEPIMVTINALLPALLYGNRVIVRPSEHAPFAPSYIVDLLLECGWDKKGIAYLPFARDDMDFFLSQKNLDFVFWTGGSRSTRAIGSMALKYGKEFTAESEGNDWALVDDTCDFKKVSRIVFESFTANGGQMCNALRGIIVKDSVYREFTEELAKLIGVAKMGDPLDKETTVGPLKDESAVNYLLEKVQESGCKALGLGHHDNFFHPCITLDPGWDSRLVKEESFGPLIWIKPSSDLEEGVKRYNELNSQRLCISVFSKDSRITEFVVSKARSTIVNVNKSPLAISPFCPWGGRGLSGFGGARNWPNKFLDNKYILRGDNYGDSCN